MSGESAAYDALPYVGEATPAAHVDALFCAAWLLGCEPADPQRCRVLEVGCADATHLLGMAAGLPQSVFVGVDGSARQVESGEEMRAAAGLDNVTLRCADLREPGEELGVFDYIVAHGVYSWVAEDARRALLGLCEKHLAPNGVAYISYNALPGWHLGRMVRGLMRFHSRKFDAPADQIAQSRAILRFVAGGALHPLHARTLSSYLPLIDRTDDDYLFHDFLEENNRPLRLVDFVAEAEAAGLSYLGDSLLHRMAGLHLPESIRAAIEGFTDDPIAQEQYLDFLGDVTLRRTLLCRPSHRPDRTLDPQRAARLSYRTALVEEVGSEPVRFRHPVTGDALTVFDPLQIATLRQLQAAAPRPVPLSALPDGAASLVLQGVLQGVIQPHAQALPVTGAVTERPEVWWFARLQAARGARPTSRLSHAVPPLSALELPTLARLDGRRTVPEIVDSLLPMVEVAQGDPRAVLTEAVGDILARCAAEGLLIQGEHEP